MRKIVFDIETKDTFMQVGSNNPAALAISVVGVYDYETDTYTSYLEEEFPKLWTILDQADLLIGYNSDHFDIPLLGKYYTGNIHDIDSLDLLKEIKGALGRRIGLGQVAQGTLNRGKIGKGLEAITWWKNGEIEKLKKYCLEDVKITKELYEYALKHGKLKYPEGTQIREFKIDTSKWHKIKGRSRTTALF